MAMPAASGSRRILVVDDEARVAETLELILAMRGYDVRVGHSAEEAIEIFAGWKPDLAIVDVMLPRMNGIELGIAIKANYPDCRLLLQSGHPGTAALLDAAREQGYDFDILAKPLHPAFLLDTVSQMLPGGEAPAES